MPYATVNGLPVIDFTLTEVTRGVWRAHVTAQCPGLDPVVTLQLGSQRTWVGRLIQGFTVYDTFVGAVRGGKGDLSKPAKAKHYRFPSVATVLRDLCNDAGETLAATCDADVLAFPLPMHTTMGLRPVGHAIEQLVAQVGPDVTWRFLDDGMLWVGRDRWPLYRGDTQIEDQSPLEGRVTLMTDEGSPLIPAGTSLDVGNVHHVEHHFEGGILRSNVFFVEETKPL